MTDRDPRISAVLDELTRPPDAGPAWDDVVRRAAGRTRPDGPRRPRLGMVATGAGLAAIGALLGTLLVAAPDETRTFGSGTLSVLDRAATANDRLPAWVVEDPVFRSEGIDLRTARRAVIDGTHGVWVARSGRTVPANPRMRGSRPTIVTRLCLVDAEVEPPRQPAPRRVRGVRGGPGGAGGVSCVPETALAGHVLAEPLAVRGKMEGGLRGDVVGLAPDGLDTARVAGREAQIVSNAFVLRDVPLSEPIHVAGPGGEVTVEPSYPAQPAGPRRIVPPGAATLSVLERPARAEDRLPTPLVKLFAIRRQREETVNYAQSQRLRPRIEEARFAGEVRGRRYWLVPDENLDVITIASQYRDGNRTLTRSARPRDRALVWSLQGGQRGPFDAGTFTLRAIVPDGYSVVRVNGRTVPVVNNFVVVGGIRGGPVHIEATGDGGRFEQNVGANRFSLRLVLARGPVP